MAVVPEPSGGSVQEIAAKIRSGAYTVDAHGLVHDAGGKVVGALLSVAGDSPQAAPPPGFQLSERRLQKAARQREELWEALEASDWNRTLAAQRLGISRVQLWRRMKQLGVAPTDDTPAPRRESHPTQPAPAPTPVEDPAPAQKSELLPDYDPWLD